MSPDTTRAGFLKRAASVSLGVVAAPLLATEVLSDAVEATRVQEVLETYGVAVGPSEVWISNAARAVFERAPGGLP